MEFEKRYSREKKGKSGRIFILTITDFASKMECIFFKRKTSFLTELIFTEKTQEISCFEPNEIFKISMKSDLHLNCFSTSELKVGVRFLQQKKPFDFLKLIFKPVAISYSSNRSNAFETKNIPNNIKVTSSTKAKYFMAKAFDPEMKTPSMRLFDIIDRNIVLIKTRNRYNLRGSPCLTPLFIGKKLLTNPFTMTAVSEF